MKAAEAIARLDAIPETEMDLVHPLYKALDGIQIDDPQNFFPSAFRYTRERSEADFGAVGPLIHLIESFFPLYVKDLAESLTIRATDQTLTLAQRIFNSARLKRDPVALKALPTLREALTLAKNRDGVEDWVVERIDEILSC
jgi:hypothetical protein